MSTEKEQDVDRTQEFIETYNLYHIELSEGERILDVTSDHFMEWLPKVIAPVSFAILAFVVAFLRASGVQFFVTGPAPTTPFDTTNVLLLFMVIIVTAAWFFLPGFARFTSKPQVGSLVLIGSGLIFLSIIVLRSQGILSFYIYDYDPATAQVNFFDRWNMLLAALAVVCLGIAWYIWVESENDHLITTDKRVIKSDKQVLGNYKIDQIFIEDIQDVISKTNTYFEYWMGFGTITVQSVRRRMVFKGAEQALKVQAAIMGEVNKIRGRRTQNNFKDMIETGVYGKPSSKQKPELRIPASTTPAFLRWLLPENPVYDDKKRTLIWHPHWVFLIVTLITPVVFLVLLLTLTFLLYYGNILTPGWLAGVTILLLGGFLGWAAYRVEDHRNDLYILSPTGIVDIDQKPWGPEDRRSASISAIQNATINTTLVSRFLKYGDVFLETAGTGQFTFHNVPNPNEVVRMINNYQDDFKSGEKERALQDTIKLIKHYHDVQVNEGELINHTSEQQVEETLTQAAPVQSTSAPQAPAATQQVDPLLRQLLANAPESR